MIDLVQEELDLFARSGRNIEIVERFEIGTGEKDIAIRIEDEEYSFIEFMWKIQNLLKQMEKRIETYRSLCDHADKETEKYKNKYNKLGGDEAIEAMGRRNAERVKQAMDLSNIK